MKKTQIIALIVAIAFGGAVFFFLNTVNEQKDTAIAKAHAADIEVVAAVGTIPQGTTITDDMLKIEKVSKGSVESTGYFKTIKDVSGQVSNSVIYANQTIVPDAISKDGSNGAALAYDIPKDKYAITIDVETYSGVGGYINKGNRVRVISSDSDGKKKTVCKDVEVLRVGNVDFASPGTALYTSLTLAVSETEAKDLLYETRASGHEVTALLERGKVTNDKEGK